MDPIIEIKSVNFTYNKGKDNEFQALVNVNLEVFPEEFIIIFGPSGCGKSTMLNIMAGLECPNDGEVTVLGRDLMKMTKNEFALYHRNQIGMIYQAYNLITSLTVLDNVALPQIFVNVSKGKREKWAKSLLERFGIDKQAKKIPTELSGGQQQRIGIARAIVNNPQIVLADEPVGNLDSVSAKNVLDILADLNEKEKKTVVMVTHNPENLVYGDRIIYMKDGVIVREDVNKDKHGLDKQRMVRTKTPIVELKDIMRTYQGLSPEQINILIMPYKAKVFVNHFITSRNMEESKAFEDVVQRKLLGTISDEELYDILHRNTMDGGVGFNKQYALKIIRRINRLVRITYFVYQKKRQQKNVEGRHDLITMDEKVDKVTEYLLNTCYREHKMHVEYVKLDRIKKAVKERIEGNIQKLDFFRMLDTPFKEGGAGLNSKTAKSIAEEMELIMILGFGISHKAKLPKLKISLEGGDDAGTGDGEDGNANPENENGLVLNMDTNNDVEKEPEKQAENIETEIVDQWQNKTKEADSEAEKTEDVPALSLAEVMEQARAREEMIKNNRKDVNFSARLNKEKSEENVETADNTAVKPAENNNKESDAVNNAKY